MNKDHHSLTQYIKDILSKYGPDAKPPNKHHPILTDDLILCLKEIIHLDKGGYFVFQNDNIVLKISGLGDHMTPLNYYTYIICRILLEIKDYSIIYKNIDNDLDLIESQVKLMDQNTLIGIAARIRDAEMGREERKPEHRRRIRRNLNCIVHCEDKNPPEWLKDSFNPFSDKWTPDILLMVQNIIIDILNENEHLISIINGNTMSTDYESMVQTELINCLGEMLIQKSSMKEASESMFDSLLSIGETIDMYKAIITPATLSKYICNAAYYEHLKSDIEDNNYYKKNTHDLRRMMNKLDKERKIRYTEELKKLKEKNQISWEQEFYGNIDMAGGYSPNIVDQLKIFSQMMKGCDGISLRNN